MASSQNTPTCNQPIACFSEISPSPGILPVTHTSVPGLNIEGGESKERGLAQGRSEMEVIRGGPRLTMRKIGVELEGDPRP